MVDVLKSVKIGVQVFEIIERTQKEDGMLNEGSYGYTIDTQNVIVIDSNLHVSKKKVTIMHEVLHAARMVFDNSVKPKKSDDFEAWEHYFFGVWENSLIMVMRDNPELMQWLVSDSY
jgi:Zn-dependent peptidase ImmA (M78 family)